MRLSRFWYLVLILLLVLVLLGGMYVYTQDQAFAVHLENDPHASDRSLSPGSESDPVFVKDMIEANNRFAFDLYANLSLSPNNTGRNLFFSPYSISSAFAITYEGTRGTTADEIRSVFHLPEEDRIRREGAFEVYERLKGGEGGYTLHMADALWAENNWSFLSAFTGIAKKYYAVDTRNLDFLQDPEGSRAVINAWTENQIAGKIKNLMPAGSIKNATALVLTNAVSFEGGWIREFSENETVKSRFHISPVNGVEVPMMYRGERDTILGYGETDELQVLEMPYSRGENEPVSMLVLLSKSDTLAAEESALNPDGLARIRSSLGYRHVDLYFPKFTLDTSYELSGTLSTMDMPKAFSSRANFSGMNGTENLYLDEVLHMAHAEVTEKGTYTAAATALALVWQGEKPAYTPVQFRAGRSFVFLIWEGETGNILFMGRVLSPEREENEWPVRI
jgi:serpin B